MAAPKLLCDTAGMDTATWLKARMHGPKGTIPYTLGGSDVSTVFGISPWRTPLELWRVKAGLDQPDDSANAGSKEMGHLLEPIVAHWYHRKTGNQVITDTGLYQHAAFPWALANLDYRFEEPTGLKGILECKTTTYYKAEDWADDQIPYYYELQGRFYMAVMDIDVCDFCCMWGTNPDTDVVVRRIHRDLNIEAMIFGELKAFIDSLASGNPPTMQGVAPALALKALARIYAKTIPAPIPVEFGTSYERSLRRIAQLQGEITDLNELIKTKKEEVDARSVRVVEAMQEYDRGQLILEKDRILVENKTRTTKRPDSDLLKKQYKSVYDDVLKTTVSRSIKVTVEAI